MLSVTRWERPNHPKTKFQMRRLDYSNQTHKKKIKKHWSIFASNIIQPTEMT